VRIWDPRTRRHTIELPSGSCRGLAFSADEKILVTCDGAGSVVRWQLPEGAKLTEFTCENPPAYDNSGVPFALTAEARFAAVGGYNGEVILVDLQEGKELWRSSGADGRGYSLAFSPDGRKLAAGTGSRAGYILILDTGTGRELLRLTGHRNAISGLVFWPDGTQLASASMDQRIGLWDLRDLTNVPAPRMLRGHKLEVWSLALLADGRSLASGSKDGEVCLWDTSIRPKEEFTTSPELAQAEWNSRAIWCLTQEGPSLTGVDLAGGDLLEWPEPSVAIQRTPLAVQRGARRACWSVDGRYLAIGATNGLVQIWDAPKRSLVAEFCAGTAEAVPLQFDVQNLRLALVVTNQFQIWSFPFAHASLSTPIPEGYEATDYSHYVAFSQQLSPGLDKILIAGDRDARLWAPASGAATQLRNDAGISPRLEDFEGCIGFSPDGALLATCGLSGKALVYDARTGVQVASLQPFFNGATCLAFSPDGARLAVGSGGDGDIKIYDVANWRELMTVPSGAEWVVSLKFSLDGAALRAELQGLGRTSMLRVWRPPSFEQITLTEAKDKP
jgi:WD40 repeat protein